MSNSILLTIIFFAKECDKNLGIITPQKLAIVVGPQALINPTLESYTSIVGFKSNTSWLSTSPLTSLGITPVMTGPHCIARKVERCGGRLRYQLIRT